MQAAAYLGVSVATFDAEVKAGYWPGPDRRGVKGGRLTWDRAMLDAAQDRHSRLKLEPAGQVETAPIEHEADAWKDRISGTTAQHRAEVRPQATR